MEVFSKPMSSQNGTPPNIPQPQSPTSHSELETDDGHQSLGACLRTTGN
jgi:hypothetical protein